MSITMQSYAPFINGAPERSQTNGSASNAVAGNLQQLAQQYNTQSQSSIVYHSNSARSPPSANNASHQFCVAPLALQANGLECLNTSGLFDSPYCAAQDQFHNTQASEASENSQNHQNLSPIFQNCSTALPVHPSFPSTNSQSDESCFEHDSALSFNTYNPPPWQVFCRSDEFNTCRLTPAPPQLGQISMQNHFQSRTEHFSQPKLYLTMENGQLRVVGADQTTASNCLDDANLLMQAVNHHSLHKSEIDEVDDDGATQFTFDDILPSLSSRTSAAVFNNHDVHQQLAPWQAQMETLAAGMNQADEASQFDEDEKILGTSTPSRFYFENKSETSSQSKAKRKASKRNRKLEKSFREPMALEYDDQSHLSTNAKEPTRLPSYEELIAEALRILGDRNGHPPREIFKCMASHYAGLLPSQFKGSATQALKKAWRKGRFLRTDRKYRVNADYSAPAVRGRAKPNAPRILADAAITGGSHLKPQNRGGSGMKFRSAARYNKYNTPSCEPPPPPPQRQQRPRMVCKRLVPGLAITKLDQSMDGQGVNTFDQATDIVGGDSWMYQDALPASRHCGNDISEPIAMAANNEIMHDAAMENVTEFTHPNPLQYCHAQSRSNLSNDLLALAPSENTSFLTYLDSIRSSSVHNMDAPMTQNVPGEKPPAFDFQALTPDAKVDPNVDLDMSFLMLDLAAQSSQNVIDSFVNTSSAYRPGALQQFAHSQNDPAQTNSDLPTPPYKTFPVGLPPTSNSKLNAPETAGTREFDIPFATPCHSTAATDVVYAFDTNAASKVLDSTQPRTLLLGSDPESWNATKLWDSVVAAYEVAAIPKPVQSDLNAQTMS